MASRGARYDDRRDHLDRPSRRPYPSHESEFQYGGTSLPPSRRHDRSRSRSPSSPDDPKERERRARMARLRAENEEEEKKLAALDESSELNESEKLPKPKEEIIEVDEEELEGLDEEEQMKRLLGFSGGFATTKGQGIEDNAKSAARGAAAKNKARKYRQYMNRKGGFNRPLDKI